MAIENHELTSCSVVAQSMHGTRAVRYCHTLCCGVRHNGTGRVRGTRHQADANKGSIADP